MNGEEFSKFKSAETQELLLIADYLITDYSSVMFDAFSIDLPVVLYCTDFEKNEEARGVYPEIWNRISYLNCQTIENVAASIKDYRIDDRYYQVKEKYGYKPAGIQNLSEFITRI